jgi:hypothetical protein
MSNMSWKFSAHSFCNCESFLSVEEVLLKIRANIKWLDVCRLTNRELQENRREGERVGFIKTKSPSRRINFKAREQTIKCRRHKKTIVVLFCLD